MEPPDAAPSVHPTAAIVGHTDAIHALRTQIARLAAFDTVDNPYVPTLLLHGETGTGKGLVARATHESGPRAPGPFVEVNCAAIPETLLEAELFGFEAGSFTDAKRAKAGLFEAASGGTLFLDEIDALPLVLQSKLLTAIEQKRIRRLGAVTDLQVDVKLIAATKEELGSYAAAGRFRTDLYHRLAVVILPLPPLRQRGEDVVVLAEHFLRQYAQAHDMPSKRLSQDAETWLQGYAWPGNVRELIHMMERVTLLCPEDVLDGPALERFCLPQPVEHAARELVQNDGDEPPGEAERIRRAIARTGGNVSLAARLLGINRNTLRYRMRRYRIERPRVEEVALPAISAPPAHAVSQAEDDEDVESVPASEAPQAQESAWEQKPVAVLAIDLTFPRASDRAAPLYEAWTVTTRWERRITEKIHGFGGVCMQHSPSLFLAVFGIPRALERMPQRAVDAALAIQSLTTETRLPDEHEPVPVVRLAVHLGAMMTDVHASDPGSASLPVGETLAFPVRLLGHARAGELLVSSEVGRQIEDSCELQPHAMPHDVETSDRVEVYRVERLKPWSLRGEQGRAYPLSPFVGRERELAALHERLAQAASGQGQVVGIIGEPGMGKSRLLLEFRTGLEAQPCTYLEGHCLSYGSTVPYLPVRDILRQQCRIVEADSTETVTTKVHQTLCEMELTPEEWEPYLVQLLGVQVEAERLATLSPETIRRRTFAALRQLILASSQQRPLIVAIEDLQWIDKTSEDFFAALVESLAGTAVLFLATYRPGYRPPRMERSYVTQIGLQSLASDESLHLVSSILQAEQVPNPVVHDILAKAEGNPFFLEELVQAVTEDSEAQLHLEVPDTIQGVLMERIDRLPDASRGLLHMASIVGREVPLKLLRLLWDGPGDMEEHLPMLQQLEFLYEQFGTDEPLYLFKHALTQEVAYASVLPSRRQALHAAAGQALETLYAECLDDVVDRLAYHYAQSADAAKAVMYLTQLALKAARSYAHVEAIATIREALVHVEHLPQAERDRQRLPLLLGQALSLSILGRFREILDLLLPQQEFVERLQEPTLAGPYYFRLAMTYNFLSDHEQVVHHARRAIAAAQQCNDNGTLGQTYYALSLKNYWCGELLQGIEHGRQAVAHLEEVEPGPPALALLEGIAWRSWLAGAQFILGVTYGCLGEFSAALEAAAQTMTIAEAMGEPRAQSFGAFTTGYIHAVRGEAAAGIEACKQALEYAPDPFSTALALGWFGATYLVQGEASQAIPLLEQAIQQFDRFQAKQTQGRFTALLGEALFIDGQFEKAHDMALQGLEICRSTQHLYGVGCGLLTLGRMALAGGACDEAECHLQAAFHTFTEMQARVEIGRTQWALAELAAAQSERDAVITYLVEAQRLFVTLRLPHYVEHTADLARRFEVTLPGKDDTPMV